jgi:NTP pyrophosphatase (non-canonical NTP hydrolase)
MIPAMTDFKQYEARAATTAFFPHVNEDGHPEAIAYCVLGLNGEAGEIAEKLKKTWRSQGGFGALSSEDKRNMLDELGDVLWYAAMLSRELGSSLDTVADWNLEKLAERAQHGAEGWSERRKQQRFG